MPRELTDTSRKGGLPLAQELRRAPAAAAPSRMAMSLSTPHARPPEIQEDGEGLQRPWSEVVRKRGRKGREEESIEEEEQDEGGEIWGREGECDREIREIGRKLRKAREEKEAMKSLNNGKQWEVREVREGDWTCEEPVCKGWSNFRWRKYCLKCNKSKEGMKDPMISAEREEVGLPNLIKETRYENLNQSPRDRWKRGLEGQREPIRRPPRMIILTINVSVGGKTRTRPQASDHLSIIRQAGLKLDEVTGKVAKPGYLEVSLIPKSPSVAKALREGPKKVDDKITITSVRERGTNRIAVIKWQEVPFDVLDETLIRYVELFAKVEKVGRSLRWETVKQEDDSNQEMVGKWTGERSIPVTLNRDIAHIPTWHYVGGGRLRLQVQGRKNCPRCLKSVGECRGGGEWRRCEASKAPAGDWKIEQERFLESLGWGESKQKILEGLEQQEAVAPLAGEEEEAETRAEEELADQEEEKRKGWTQELDEEKICGGLILKNFPEITNDKKKEKKEALWMIFVASNLTEDEEEQLNEAKVEVIRSGKVVEVRISLEGAGVNILLRKVWKRLEKACKQENVKRFQVEASTPITPPKVKPLTVFQKAREIVKDIMEKEEVRRVQEKEIAKKEDIKKKENYNKERDLEKEKRKEIAHRDIKKNEETSVIRNKSQKTRIPWDCHDKVFSTRQSINALHCNAQNRQIDLSPAPPKIVIEKKDANTGDEGVGTEEYEDNGGSSEVSRIRNPIWKAPAGMRRCGQNCGGCETKCVELGLIECGGCWSNKEDPEKIGRKVKKSPCYGRGPCLDIRSQKPQKNSEHVEQESVEDGRARSKTKITSTSKSRRVPSLSVVRAKENLSERASKSPVSREVVGSQLVVLKPGLVAHIGVALEASAKGKDEEEIIKKRGREETGVTPEKEQEKPAAKATKTAGGGSRLAQPIIKGGSGARGEKPPALNL